MATASNLRLVTLNSLDTKLALTTDTTSGTLVAANLATDIKGDVWRATTTSGAITATWTAAQTINMVAIPFTNLTNAATMRVRGYTNVADADGSPLFDTTALACCPYATGAITSPGVANFGYGGAVYSVLWFTGGSVKRILVNIADSTNAAGYIEAGRLICGDWFSPTNNADYGLSMGYVDRSDHSRDGGGGLRTRLRTRNKSLKFNLANLSLADRATFFKMLRNGGKAASVFISAFPIDSNASMVQDGMIYGRMSSLSMQTYDRLLNFTQSIDFEEI